MSVQGFDYLTAKTVTMTPAEWRAKYPAPKYRRVAADGETAYYTTEYMPAVSNRVAEAYAIIPAGKVP